MFSIAEKPSVLTGRLKTCWFYPSKQLGDREEIVMRRSSGVKSSVTVKEVARHAGVSIATVSHVINKTRYVTPETTARVNDAIKELGYYPNLLVSGLVKKKSYTIGLVLPSISNETFGLLAETIQKNLFQLGYNLIICNTSYDLDIEEEAYNTLLMKKADAIIAIPSIRGNGKLAEISAMGVPIFLIDRVIPGLAVDIVRVDNVKGAHSAVKHLIDLGHRAIGYIDRKVDQSHSLEQKIGYKMALEEQGIEFDQRKFIRATGYDYESGAAAARELIRKNPDLTAIFAYYDIVALGALSGIQKMGYSVPEQFSVIGFDGMPVTNVSNPRLTTVAFPVQRIAKITCDLLIKRLERTGDQRENPEEVVLVPRLIVRDSTAHPRPEVRL
jgi:DNA-binding LacI/PurR family transcriptional regulator